MIYVNKKTLPSLLSNPKTSKHLHEGIKELQNKGKRSNMFEINGEFYFIDQQALRK